METQTRKQPGPRIGADYIPKASSKDPIIATVYKPYGDKKPGNYPDGFQEEDFWLGKKPPAPEPARKSRIGFDLGGMDSAYSGPAKKKPGYTKDYGKDSPDLDELLQYFSEWASKYMKDGKGKAKVGLVLMPNYERN